MQDYKLVIFDWDGTLMDSVDRIVSSMQSAAKTVGLDVPSNDEVKQIIGLSLTVALEELFIPITKDQIEAMLVQYKYQYLEGDNTPTPLFENALSLLTELQQKSMLLAVATGKGREGLHRVLTLSETSHFFHTTRCAGEMPSKPDPTMLNSILEELDVSPNEAIMIGDTSHDLAMAQNANIDSIGVTFGVHDTQVLKQYEPKAIVHSLNELKSLLI
jgi:phosphoglycolate phosphatase